MLQVRKLRPRDDPQDQTEPRQRLPSPHITHHSSLVAGPGDPELAHVSVCVGGEEEGGLGENSPEGNTP